MAYDALYDQFTDQAMGDLTEQLQPRRRQADPRGAGRVRRPVAPARRRRRGRTASSTTRSSRSRSRSGGASRSWSARTRASAATPRPSRSAKLRPAFSKDGTITAGSASQISDGACAVVVMSKAKAEELGLELARRDRCLRSGRRPRLHAAAPAGERDREGDARRRASRSPTSTCSSSTRRSPRSASSRRRELGIDSEEGQRQRRRDRPRPPGGHVRCPDRAAPRPRAEAPRRRHRRGRAVRRRRPGRRPDHPRAPVPVTAVSRRSPRPECGAADLRLGA